MRRHITDEARGVIDHIATWRERPEAEQAQTLLDCSEVVNAVRDLLLALATPTTVTLGGALADDRDQIRDAYFQMVDREA